MGKIVKNAFGNFLIVCLIFSLAMGWMFSGWPRIWQKPPIPPKVQTAHAAIAIGDVSTGSVDGTTLTISHTVASGETLLIVLTGNDTASANVTAVTFGGVALTQFSEFAPTHGKNRVEVWYRVNPSVSTANVVITTSGKTAGAAISVSGADTTTPLDGAATAEGNSTAPSRTVTSATGDLVMDVVASLDKDTNFTAGAGQTENFADFVDSGGGFRFMSSREAGAGTVTMSWSGSSAKEWGQIGFNINAASTFEQSAYRLFNNANSTDVGTALAALNTAATLGSSGAAFRLRALLHIGVNQLALSGQSFKLQFVGKGTGTCAAPSGGTPSTYTDVTAATVIAYNDNATPADGAALTANANDPTHGADTIVNQTYEELNNFTNSVAAIPAGQDGKWDFALKDNSAPASTAYCFRVVKSDGTIINTYTVIPEITTAAAATVSCASSPGSTSFGELSSSATSFASPNASTSMSCSGTDFGCALYVKDAGNTASSGLATTSPAYLIPSPNADFSASATLAAGTEGYGIQATTTSVGLTIDSRYNQTGDIVGGLSLSENIIIASSTADITDGEVIVTHMAAISETTPSGIYEDTITYSCVSN